MPRTTNNMYDSTGQLSNNYRYNLASTISKDLLILHLKMKSTSTPVKILPSGIETNLKNQPLFTVGFPVRAAQEIVDRNGLPKNVGNLTNCYFDNSINLTEDAYFNTDCITTGGNSGGPLFTYIDDRLYLVGINSVSNGNTGEVQNFLGRNNIYSVHVNINYNLTRDWLLNFL